MHPPSDLRPPPFALRRAAATPVAQAAGGAIPRQRPCWLRVRTHGTMNPRSWTGWPPPLGRRDSWAGATQPLVGPLSVSFDENRAAPMVTLTAKSNLLTRLSARMLAGESFNLSFTLPVDGTRVGYPQLTGRRADPDPLGARQPHAAAVTRSCHERIDESSG